MAQKRKLNGLTKSSAALRKPAEFKKEERDLLSFFKDSLWVELLSKREWTY